MDRLSYGELSEAGFCTMAAHHLQETESPLMTHEVTLEGIVPFRCCVHCALAYSELDPIGVVVRDLSRGQA